MVEKSDTTCSFWWWTFGTVNARALICSVDAAIESNVQVTTWNVKEKLENGATENIKMGILILLKEEFVFLSVCHSHSAENERPEALKFGA